MAEYLRSKLGQAVRKLLGALVLSAGIAAPLFAVSIANIDVNVRPTHSVAPERITDMSAASGSGQGQIDLTWTAPQTYLDIKVRDYYIRWSSNSVNDAPFTGDTTAWWNASGGQDLYSWMNNPGETVNWEVNGLVPSATYYFSIKAEDEFGNLSDFDEKTIALAQANAAAGVDSTPPASVLNLTALTGENEGEVKLRWTAPGDDGTEGQLIANLPPYYNSFVYELRVSEFGLSPYGGSADAWWSMAPIMQTIHISTAQAPGTEQTLVITGLTPGAELWFGLKAYDDGANWSTTLNVSSAMVSPDVMAPSAVTDLIVSDNSTANALTLRWTAPGDDGTEGDIVGGAFEIRYSTTSGLESYSTSGLESPSYNVAAGSTQSYTVAGLLGDTTYYFALRTADDGGNWSALSNTATGWTLDNVPPSAPTGLTVLAGDGEASLSWNANTEDDFSAYLIYRSTDAVTYTNILSTDSLALTDAALANFTTYYYYLTARDLTGNESAASTVVSAMPQPPPDVTAPSAVTDLIVSDNSAANALTLRWTAPGDDGTSGDIVNGTVEIRYSTTSGLESPSYISISTSVAAGSTQSYTLAGLLGDTTYYFALRTADASANWSALSNTATGWTLDNVPPSAPTAVTAIAGDREVSLSWNINTEDDFSAYLIYRSTDAINYTNILSTVSSAFTDTGLVNFTTYYYYLTARDLTGNESAASSVVSAMPRALIADDIAPDAPAGVYGEISADGTQFTLNWATVTINSDGTPCTDLAGYRIYRSTGIWGPFTLVDSTTLTDYTIARSTADAYFYAVTAFDSAEPYNESGMSMLADTADEANLWVLLDGAVVRIPAEIASILREGFDEEIIISTDSRKYAEENYPAGRVLRSYNFETLKNLSKEKVNVVFSRARAEIKIYYGVSAGGTIQSLSVNEAEAANSLSLMWHNGVEWVKIGGEVNRDDRSVRILTDKLGRYQLRVAPRATAFSVIDGPIPKIFTPNGDGFNDECSFFYENPNAFAPSGEIFDIRGRKVADMKLGSVSSAVSGSLVWDGKTSSGSSAAPGVYVWQIQAEGRVYNGTVVVAR